MTRRLKRHQSFEIALRITDDDFIRPPREAQRNWLINRALLELVLDLEHLDRLADRFVAGSDEMTLRDRTQAVLSDEEIMEDWQIPVMQAMADVVTESHGDVLEIGFGRGGASDLIQEKGVRSHTVVERCRCGALPPMGKTVSGRRHPPTANVRTESTVSRNTTAFSSTRIP